MENHWHTPLHNHVVTFNTSPRCRNDPPKFIAPLFTRQFSSITNGIEITVLNLPKLSLEVK